MVEEHDTSTAPIEAVSTQSAPDAPAQEDTKVAAEQQQFPSDESATANNKGKKKRESDASRVAGGKRGIKSETPRGRGGRRGGGRKEVKDRENLKKEDRAGDTVTKEEKDGSEEGKEKPAPYVNEDRFKTGGTPRAKLSPEELAARIERIRLNNEKIKERRAAVEADAQAFYESQAELREREERERRILADIDEKRAAVARRKMDRAGAREWDSFKEGANANAVEGEGTDASMHAPTSFGNGAEGGWPAPEENSWGGWGESADSNANGNETEDGWPAPDPDPGSWPAAEVGDNSNGNGNGTEDGWPAPDPDPGSWPAAAVDDNSNAIGDSWPAEDTWVVPEVKEKEQEQVQQEGKGRGRGRGTGRGGGRGKERGDGRGRGGRGGGRGGRGRGRGGEGASTRRDKPPHIKNKSEATANTTGGVLDPAAYGWPDIDGGAEVSQQTGIAITTNDEDPWGVANADDPWGVPAAGNEPGGAAATDNDSWGVPAAEAEAQKS